MSWETSTMLNLTDCRSQVESRSTGLHQVTTAKQGYAGPRITPASGAPGASSFGHHLSTQPSSPACTAAFQVDTYCSGASCLKAGPCCAAGCPEGPPAGSTAASAAASADAASWSTASSIQGRAPVSHNAGQRGWDSADGTEDDALLCEVHWKCNWIRAFAGKLLSGSFWRQGIC